MAVAHRLGG